MDAKKSSLVVPIVRFVISNQTLLELLDECLDNIKLRDDTCSYIKGTLKEGLKNEKDFDLSDQSLSLLYLETLKNGNFKDYQRIGDWVVFVHSIFSIDFEDPLRKFEIELAQKSYAACFNMLNSWLIFEELSNRLPIIVRTVNKAMKI